MVDLKTPEAFYHPQNHKKLMSQQTNSHPMDLIKGEILVAAAHGV